MGHRPDLIVPIHDRRRRKRYLTLKNFGMFVLVLVAAFILISIRSEMRSMQPGEYGRLFRSEVPSVEPKPLEIVREEAPPVDEQTHADPMLTEPMVRSQWLQDETATTTIAPAAAAPTVRTGSGDVAVVGGPEGLAVVRKERTRPVLSGGFGRQ